MDREQLFESLGLSPEQRVGLGAYLDAQSPPAPDPAPAPAPAPTAPPLAVAPAAAPPAQVSPRAADAFAKADLLKASREAPPVTPAPAPAPAAIPPELAAKLEAMETWQRAEEGRRLREAVAPLMAPVLWETAHDDALRRLQPFLNMDPSGNLSAVGPDGSPLLHPVEKRPVKPAELVADLREGAITGQAAPHYFKPRHDGRPSPSLPGPTASGGGAMYLDLEACLALAKSHSS